MNNFAKANILAAGTSFTENGAASYATIGSALLDQFGKAGTARGRAISDVWAEQSKLWAEDPENALRFPFYLRLITRQTNVTGDEKTETVQRGQGARDESFKRLLWIAKYHPEKFYDNLWLLPVVGSWKDLWSLLVMDDTLDKQKFFTVMAGGISDPNAKDLVKKYMPRIRSNEKCKTEWALKTNELAKEFAKFAGWSYRDYRIFKSTGRAHKFQTIICEKRYSDINWKAVPGKALLNLVSGKFLERHSLTKDYMDWLNTQPTAKFTGYAFDLARKLGKNQAKVSRAARFTIDKQFNGLIEQAKQDGGAITGNVLCALDTSGSMENEIKGANGVTSFDVCVSLGIYFSELNTGAFHNTVAMFDNVSRMMELKGSFSDKWYQITHATTAWGGTDFQSLIKLICDTRVHHPEIPLDEFPKTLLVISDMQFNATTPIWNRSTHHWEYVENTNYEAALRQLRTVFPEEFVNEFKFVWWYCAGRTTADFPSTMEDAGTYMFSGFDGAIVSFLLGGDGIEETPEQEEKPKAHVSMQEIVTRALSQPVLQLIK